ncbi:MAG: Na+/H+ antiporter subunit E [Coriobacteriia bacterium]|nr:Na+/H+ antiporter subunit E [Coriobacteriia bacterium]
MSGTPTQISTRERLRHLFWRTVGLTLVWVVITEAAVSSFAVGIPLALLGAALSVIVQPRSLSAVYVPGVMRYLAFFAIQSLLGGVDVARRALSPSMPLDPACVRYPLRIAGDGPRVVFANTISLLPGTLSARFLGDVIEVHVLDNHARVLDDLARVEERVAGLFGTNLPPYEAGEGR